MKQLVQKTFGASKTFTIVNDGLHILTKDVKEEIGYKIKFHELGFDVSTKADKRGIFLFYFWFAFDVLCIWAIIDTTNKPLITSQYIIYFGGVIFFGALTVSAFMNRVTRKVFLTGGSKNLDMSGDKPDTETVENFIAEIHKAMRQYYKEVYTIFEDEMPYHERIAQLKWLKQIDAITDAEYNSYTHVSQIQGIIGFQRSDENDE